MRTVSVRRFVAITAATCLCLPALLHSQTPTSQPEASARIAGRVVDKRTGEGISNAGVQIVGTETGVQTGMDGRYVLSRVAPGTVTLHVRRLGFAPKTVTGIILGPGQVLEQDITLEPMTVALQTQVVTASAERGTVSEALDQQRTSNNVVNAVTREQIARSPDSDAAQAVQRVSGVTVQDGRYVFVRGLGERYTTTSLNGARLPSPEPERKVVPLDLFPAALLQTVTTTKNFTPDQPGDFSGAQVDIRTREFPVRRQTQFSTTFGWNSLASGENLLLPITLSGDRFGFAGAERELPPSVRAAGAFQSTPSQEEVNTMVSSFRNAWTPRSDKGTPNTSFGASTGGTTEIFGARTGYIGSFSYSHNQEVRAEELRAFATGGPDGTTVPFNEFRGQTGRASVLWGGLFNASMLLGRSTQISLNNTFNRTSDNEARREVGFDENLAQRLQIDRMRFIERSVYSSQLAGSREFGSRLGINLSFTGSGVVRNEPDRTEFVRVIPEDGTAPYWLSSPEGAVKTFAELDERAFNTAGDLSIKLGKQRQSDLKFGGLYRRTLRDAVNRVYSIQAPSLTVEQRRLPAEEIFTTFSAPGNSVFRVQPLSQGSSYDAWDELAAGYGMVNLNVSDRLGIVAGARVEYSLLDIDFQCTGSNAEEVERDYTDVLPSLAMNVRLRETQNLRISASQTLARPEYRELVGCQQRDVIGGENFIGNPALERTLVQNADIRWEWYPRPGEVVSIGLFGKKFESPIERILLATSGTRVSSFYNAESATNFGVELDLRAGLDFLGSWLSPFSAFSNLTLVQSDVSIGRLLRLGSAEYQISDENRAMVGQAPYVVNFGLTYAPIGHSTSAMVLFNQVGKRIAMVSDGILPVTYEMPRSVLDVSLRYPLFAGFSGRFDAKNILDEPYELVQGTTTREYYKSGRVFSLGLSWQP